MPKTSDKHISPITPDSTLAAWFEDDGRGLPWVDQKHARAYANACAAAGIPFTNDDGEQISPANWLKWAR